MAKITKDGGMYTVCLEIKKIDLAGLENSTLRLVFTSASGRRASENFDISGEN